MRACSASKETSLGTKPAVVAHASVLEVYGMDTIKSRKASSWHMREGAQTPEAVLDARLFELTHRLRLPTHEDLRGVARIRAFLDFMSAAIRAEQARLAGRWRHASP